MHNDAGTYTGFEVSNRLLSRRRACRIAGDVPGSHVQRWPRRFAWSDPDFCEFALNGVQFLIIEPFDDNDCYWVVAKEPAPDARAEIERVRAAFEGAWG
jgi:hypothetical protein